MAAYLLAWNPKRWRWHHLASICEALKNGEKMTISWSCHSKRIRKGDRVFLIRLGKEPRGIFGSGSVVSDPYEDLHWDHEKASAGIMVSFVRVELDVLLNPESDPILPRELLEHSPFSAMRWDTQISGVRIPDDVYVELEKTWLRFTG